jgi:hypothetical protein
MSSGVVSSWPVLVSLPIDAGEYEPGGALTDDAIEHVFGVASATYFDLCSTFDGATSEAGPLEVRRGNARVTIPSVTVSVGVGEVFPDRFLMAARIRADGDDGIVADVQRSVAPAGGVGDAVRDELIALAHSARHWH